MNVTSSLTFEMCNDALDYEFRSFYLCGRKIVDLQFKSADGRLAEDEGFIAALHLNHTETRKF